MLAFGIYYYPMLPSTIPIHWDYRWVANSFAPKEKAVFLLPFFALGMLVLFQFLPKLDPKKDNYPKFAKAWEAFQISILIFFAYAYFLSILVNIYPLDMQKYLMLGIWLLFVVLWNYMWKIRRNYFVWIRLPWTIENEEVWNKTHRFGWKMFMVSWVLFILDAFLKAKPGLVLIALLILSVFVPLVYSYIIYKKISWNAK